MDAAASPENVGTPNGNAAATAKENKNTLPPEKKTLSPDAATEMAAAPITPIQAEPRWMQQKQQKKQEVPQQPQQPQWWQTDNLGQWDALPVEHQQRLMQKQQDLEKQQEPGHLNPSDFSVLDDSFDVAAAHFLGLGVDYSVLDPSGGHEANDSAAAAVDVSSPKTPKSKRRRKVGGKVPRFGTTAAMDEKSHERNPKTGQRVEVAPKRLPFFKCGKDLKDRVDK